MSTAIAPRHEIEITANDQGLAALLSTPITTPVEYTRRLQQFTQYPVHLLSPFSSLSGLAPQHEIQPVQTFLNPSPAGGDVYGGLPWLRGSEVAPAKNGLLKIADAFGARLTAHFVSVGSIRNYWHISFTIEYRDIDGTMQGRSGSQEWDLRADSDRIKGWTERQITEGRKNGLRQCETRAINAAIRQCGGGMKQKYTAEELAWPFVVFRVVYKPDMNDRMQKRFFLERANAATGLLYGQARMALPSVRYDDDDDVDLETGEVFAGEVAAPSTPPSAPVMPMPISPPLVKVPAGPTAPAAKTPDTDAPPCAGAVRIVSVRRKADGEPWDVTDSSGTVASTFKEALVKAAKSFEASKAWVTVAAEKKSVGDKTVNALLELTPAGAEEY